MKVIAPGDVEIELGTVEVTPTIGIIDYSRRVTDEFGVTTVVPRGFARRMSVRLALPFENVDGVQRSLADLRATPAKWIADDRFEWLSVEGFYKDFDLDLALPPLSYCTLTVEGLAETATVTEDNRDPAPEGSASSLLLLQPVAIDGSVLTASNIAEDDYPIWAMGTIYALGDRVIRTETHRIYESVSEINLGNVPGGVSGLWTDVGPTNRWAMFDEALGTSTTAEGSIVVSLDAGSPRGVALLDIVGATVRVQAPGYDQTADVGPGPVTFLDLPGVAGMVTVTISGAGTVSVGTLLIGQLVSLGVTGESPTAGITDYSRKEVDDFGEMTIVERAWAKRMTARALISTEAVDLVANRIAAVRARPALWIGDDGTDSLTVYGFFKDFSIEVGENVSTLSLSIEGLSKAAPVPAPPPVGIGTTRAPDVPPLNPPVGSLHFDAVNDQYRFEGLALTFDGQPLTFGDELIIGPGYVYVVPDALGNNSYVIEIVPPQAQTVFTDFAGDPLPQQFPRTLTPTVKRGGVDIRTGLDVTYSIVTAGVTAEVNNILSHPDKGRITVAAGGTGYIQLTVTVEGVAYGPYKIAFTVSQAAAPITGGGGTGPGGIVGTATTFPTLAIDTFQTIAGPFTATIASGEDIRCTFPASYSTNRGLTYKAVTVTGKWQTSPAGADTWTDAPGSPITGSISTWEPEEWAGEVGSGLYNQTISGLAAGDYDVRFLAVRNLVLGSASAHVEIFNSTATVLIQ